MTLSVRVLSSPLLLSSLPLLLLHHLISPPSAPPPLFIVAFVLRRISAVTVRLRVKANRPRVVRCFIKGKPLAVCWSLPLPHRLAIARTRPSTHTHKIGLLLLPTAFILRRICMLPLLQRGTGRKAALIPLFLFLLCLSL